jgi:hypothetical protein
MYNYKTNNHIKEEVLTKMYTWIINLEVYRLDNVLQNMYSEVCVTQSVVFIDPFGHCIVCPFSIYRFWLPLWGIFSYIPNPYLPKIWIYLAAL